MSNLVHIDRPAAIPPVATGKTWCGAAEIDITPHVGLPMSGYSISGKSSEGVHGRLFARALYLEDAAGRRAAICVLDLMSGSRYLLEKTASLTADTAGISVDRLILAGTHTHTAPGGFHGSSLYNEFAAARAGFDAEVADWVAERTAAAIDAAENSKVEAQIATSQDLCVWGEKQNRARGAFAANPEAATWNQAGAPGAAAPAGLSAEQAAVDPRLFVLAAYAKGPSGPGTPFAVLALWACHGTALGADFDLYSPDWFGEAARGAARQLAGIGADSIVLVGNAAGGDMSPMRPDLPQGPALARRVGQAVGRAIAAEAMRLRPSAHDFSVDVRYAEPAQPGDSVPGVPNTQLAPGWEFGAPTIGGAPDGRSFFSRSGLVYDGMTRAGPPAIDDHQYPKLPAVGVLQDLLRCLKGLDAASEVRMHVLRLDDCVLVSVPGEPTVTAGWRIEQAVLSSLAGAGVTRAWVIGYAGDYGGYYTTPEEYDHQTYEGASMLFGRNAANHVRARLAQLAAGNAPPAAGPGVVTLEVGHGVNRFSMPASSPPAQVTPVVSRDGLSVTVYWQMGTRIRPEMAPGIPRPTPGGPAPAPVSAYFARLEENRGAGWTPVVVGGQPVDDVWGEIVLRRRIERPGRIPIAAWSLEATLPALPEPGRRLRLHVLPRGRFPGFDTEIR
ncbi:MAG: neutral/alkaline non-lysosomal ceramidase N-terminal domain-containing protein [Planctomycetes bacterium]|nr:neutral/alkaline non-lysosomal ceramidase N-terminal domain-containing protein [Planctomycetota bacterium]